MTAALRNRITPALAEGERDDILRASRAWQPGAVHGLEWGSPLRPGTPRAGEAGYEPGRDAMAERRANRIGWACIGLGVILFWLILGAFALLRWRNGVMW